MFLKYWLFGSDESVTKHKLKYTNATDVDIDSFIIINTSDNTTSLPQVIINDLPRVSIFDMNTLRHASDSQQLIDRIVTRTRFIMESTTVVTTSSQTSGRSPTTILSSSSTVMLDLFQTFMIAILSSLFLFLSVDNNNNGTLDGNSLPFATTKHLSLATIKLVSQTLY